MKEWIDSSVIVGMMTEMQAAASVQPSGRKPGLQSSRRCPAVASVLSRGSKGEKSVRNCNICTLSNGVRSHWRVSQGGVTGDLPFLFERLTPPALAPDQK